MFAGIIHSAMDAIITVDETQTVVLFNKAAEKMFLCPASEAIGKPLGNFLPQRFREAHTHHIQKFDRSQVTDRAMGHQRPLTALRADGQEFPIEASISQAESQGKKHFTAIVRDISERVRVQRLLSEMEARYRTIFQHAGVGILLIDQRGMIIDANPATEKLLAYTSDQLRQQPYIMLVHPHDIHIPQIHTLFNNTRKQASLELQIRFLTQDKKPVWARVVHTAVRESLETPPYFIAVIEDITRKKRAQLRLKRLRSEHQDVIDRISTLTARERQVMWLMIDGHATKVIASQLGASPKTVDVHRGRVMSKMAATSLPQLVQMVMPIRKHFTQLTD